MLQLAFVTVHIFWNFKKFEEKPIDLNEMSVYNLYSLN